MTREEAVSARLARISPAYRNHYLRASAGTASPRAAIKSFCLECVGYARKEVTNCTSLACPLYLYRPYQNGDEE